MIYSTMQFSDVKKNRETKAKSETEEDTKMKKKEWKHRKQIRGEMTEKG